MGPPNPPARVPEPMAEGCSPRVQTPQVMLLDTAACTHSVASVRTWKGGLWNHRSTQRSVRPAFP